MIFSMLDEKKATFITFTQKSKKLLPHLNLNFGVCADQYALQK